MTTSSGDNNVEKERGGQYERAMVALLLLIFDAYIFLLIMFAAAVNKLSPLM